MCIPVYRFLKSECVRERERERERERDREKRERERHSNKMLG